MSDKKWFRVSKFSRRWFYPISLEGWVFLPCWLGLIVLNFFIITKVQESLVGLLAGLFSLCVLILGVGIFVQNKTEDPLLDLMKEASVHNRKN